MARIEIPILDYSGRERVFIIDDAMDGLRIPGWPGGSASSVRAGGPGRPLNLRALIGDDGPGDISITLLWDEGPDGGSDIVRYELTAFAQQETIKYLPAQTKTPAEAMAIPTEFRTLDDQGRLRIRLSDITVNSQNQTHSYVLGSGVRGGLYDITLRAVNGVRAGPDAALTVLMPDKPVVVPPPLMPGQPGPPTDINFTLNAERTHVIGFTWKLPENVGGTGVTLTSVQVSFRSIRYTLAGGDEAFTLPAPFELAGGVTYSVTITVTNSGGLSNSASNTYTQPRTAPTEPGPTGPTGPTPSVPDEPTAPVLRGAPGDGEVGLSWSGATAGNRPIGGYERRTGTGTPVDVGNRTSVTVGSLTNETEYAFQVRTYNSPGSGEERLYSPWSNTVRLTPMAGTVIPVTPEPDPEDVTVPLTAPGRPRSLSVVGYVEALRPAWMEPVALGTGGAFRYQVEREGSGIVFTGVRLYLDDQNLTAGTTYRYRVRAQRVRGAGIVSGPWTAWVSGIPLTDFTVTRTTSTVPGAPDGLLLTPTARTIESVWRPPRDDGSAVGDAAPVLRYQVSVDNALWVSPSDPLYRHIISGLEPGARVNVRVRAVNKNGPGAVASATISTLAVAQFLLTPDSPRAVQATFAQPPGIDSYRATTVWNEPTFVRQNALNRRATDTVVYITPPVTSYEIRTSIDNGATYTAWINTGLTRSHLVSGILVGDEPVQFIAQVRAINSVGRSDVTTTRRQIVAGCRWRITYAPDLNIPDLQATVHNTGFGRVLDRIILLGRRGPIFSRYCQAQADAGGVCGVDSGFTMHPKYRELVDEIGFISGVQSALTGAGFGVAAGVATVTIATATVTSGGAVVVAGSFIGITGMYAGSGAAATAALVASSGVSGITAIGPFLISSVVSFSAASLGIAAALTGGITVAVVSLINRGNNLQRLNNPGTYGDYPPNEGLESYTEDVTTLPTIGTAGITKTLVFGPYVVYNGIRAVDFREATSPQRLYTNPTPVPADEANSLRAVQVTWRYNGVYEPC